MQYLRGALAAFVFALAALGSIWIGWSYASPHTQVPKQAIPSVLPTNTANTRTTPSDEAQPVRDYGALPDLGSMKAFPGSVGDSNLATELNGFPTISKEAIERAAGYSDHSVPNVEAPLKFGESLNTGDSSASVVPTP